MSNMKTVWEWCLVHVSVWGHGCVFGRPSEWERQALLGLTAVSWCCSRKHCWTCWCVLAASLLVSVSIVASHFFKTGCWSTLVWPLMLSFSSALTLLIIFWTSLHYTVARSHVPTPARTIPTNDASTLLQILIIVSGVTLSINNISII